MWFDFSFPAPPPHRRDLAFRGRSKSRDRGSKEFLPAASAPAQRSCSPSPEPPGHRGSVASDGPVEDLARQFSHLGSQECPPPASNPSAAVVLGGTPQGGGNQRLAENGSAKDLFYGNHSHAPLTFDLKPAFDWKGPASWQNDQDTGKKSWLPSSPVFSSSPGSPQTPETITTRKTTAVLSSDHVNAERRSGNQDGQHFPLFADKADGMAVDATSTRLANYQTPSSRQREKSLPRNPDTGTPRSHLPTAGQMTGDGAAAFVNGNHTEETFWASQSVHSASRWMDKVMDKTTDIGKTGATGLGFMAAVKGKKDVLCSGIQGLTSRSCPHVGSPLPPYKAPLALPKVPSFSFL